ncbi:facilitated trehalose transporter Tret1 [Drosophila serrata]|uniref:facilitated trehalose transporter Tret1 n=1 Tax=Drosophila serrata TaxID=7274 RepID=UPI000A1D16C2|nr:facilitated trehalose transporter Tret1 [Drosophila serrata]
MGRIIAYIAGLLATQGAFCLGTVIGWSGPMEASIKDGSAYKFKPNIVEWGLIGSLMTLGGACSCVPTGILIDRMGRKVTMLSMVLPLTIGWLLIIFAQHVGMLVMGRFLLGFSGASYCVSAPMYNTEIAELSARGIMGCFFQLQVVLGILYAFIMGAFVSSFYFNIACAICPVIFFLFFIWMPESPVFLAQKGKIERAKKSLQFLHGKNAAWSDEIKDISGVQETEKESVGKMLSRKSTIKGLLLSIMLMFFQQFTGINAVIFYSTSMFAMAKTHIEPKFSTIVIGVVQLLAIVPSILLVERLGRKILLLFSAFLMGTSLLLMSLGFGYLHTFNIGWLALIDVCCFIIGFSVGFGPIPWLMIGELFAEDVKALAGSVSGTTNWLFAFVVTMVFPLLNDYIGPTVCFGIFSVIAALAFILVLILLPETKGKTLDEIAAKLGEKRG